MAEINAQMVKELRARTNAGILDCKEALQEADGDIEKAVDLLRKKGLATALKRAGRETSEGAVNSYIHAGGKLGVLVEVNCETDFVAKTDEFKEFARNLAMHIAATKPLGIEREDISEEVVKREEEIYRQQALDMGKPEKILDKIMQGKMDKFYKEVCLLEQVYVKNTDITIKDLLHEMVTKTGESISVRRFVRYQLGGE
ncbi:MAG: translation elongation factor Ts [Deltaproteobacteria bacterium]|nr:translation elongation factor Ts [Deltaproteobacteria bacterium]MBW2264999.1 translation elongation factor Ts [Deltaproteobacteria bacterium]MBW2318831.1 translation elongation factor Ts [Deltaproteobacteria bacterium]MBW2600471.1 translation elongation factor Ts [Deltaproteobacteria bacterium]